MYTTFLRISARVLVPLAVLAATLVQAQTMGDPTRPASAWLAAQDPRMAAQALADSATPGVQIVVVGPARKFAIVNGHAVRPGETYNGSKLMAVDQGGIVWQKDGTSETSSMSPSVVKTASRSHEAKPVAPKAKRVLNGGVQ